MNEAIRPGDSTESWVDRLPRPVQPFARLSRFDRPIGFWLLALPCWMGVTFGALHSDTGWNPENLFYMIVFGIGAVAMRGAGCTYNDIVDRDLDAKVDRTALRPLPAGQITVTSAWLWLALQLAIGFCVWLCLPWPARIVALFSIPLVAAYPYMKRITWWPQAWLGLTFNWGFPVGYVAAGGDAFLWPVFFYFGLMVWTIGYDTIYARQDVEDDALVGIRSTARLFGDHSLPAITLLYTLSGLLIGLALSFGGPRIPGVIVTLAFFGHLIWQIWSYKRHGDKVALQLFKSNRFAGLLLVFGTLVTDALAL